MSFLNLAPIAKLCKTYCITKQLLAMFLSD